MLLIIDEISQDNVSTAKTNVIFGLKLIIKAKQL